jgi:protein-disulfide isomerase/uncharacterized membrane protein
VTDKTSEASARPIRRWPLRVLLVVLAFGVVAGALMTWHHETQLYGGGGELIGCTESATVSCAEVNTSAWSEVLGVPLATWAVATYLTFAALVILALRGRRAAGHLLVFGGGAVSALSILLLYVSISQIGFVCSWCLRLYLVNAATLALAWIAVGFGRPDRATVLRAAAIFVRTALLVIGAQRFYRHHLLGDAPVLADTPTGPATVEHDPASPVPPRTFEVTSEGGKSGSLVIAAGDAWKGNPRAKVTLVEFADFQCGHCRNVSTALSSVFEKYGDRVLFVFKHYPLDPMCNPGVVNLKHILGCPAARAGVCAREQGKFWAFHDLVYANQSELSLENLRVHAEHAGVDLARFVACVEDPRSLDAVRSNGELGKALNLHGTPRIFIGGALYSGGRAPEAIARALEAALGATP